MCVHSMIRTWQADVVHKPESYTPPSLGSGCSLCMGSVAGKQCTMHVEKNECLQSSNSTLNAAKLGLPCELVKSRLSPEVHKQD